jgi:hypothetical protein
MIAWAQQTKWRELYRAALRETDDKKLPNLIAEAERALIARSRELFSTPMGNAEEAQSVDDALYALRALRSCLRLKTRENEAA